MRRVAEPLSRMGARIDTSSGGTLPVRVSGGARRGIRYELPVASAQVKSAILIAGLGAPGETTVVEPVPTRDHTERMLEAMGVPLRRDGREITVAGPVVPRAIETRVPGDFSSAAFLLAAAAAVPGSEVTVTGVGVNPGRTGLLEVLARMGCTVERTNERTDGGEPVADLTVAAGPLRAVTVDDPALLTALIDEVPAIAVLAARAEGTTVIRGASELRRKESDRIAAIAASLAVLGADVAELDDGLRITGPTPLSGGAVSSYGDHRMAMAMAVAGLVAEGGVEIDDASVVGVSYPRFFDDVRALCDSTGGPS
jgi:3-phosphoshikimate 1-carboxyvinyltransferase